MVILVLSMSNGLAITSTYRQRSTSYRWSVTRALSTQIQGSLGNITGGMASPIYLMITKAFYNQTIIN